MAQTHICGACAGSGADYVIDYGLASGLREDRCEECHGTGRVEVPIVCCEACGAPGASPAMGAGNLCDDCDIDRPAVAATVTAQQAARACLHGNAS